MSDLIERLREGVRVSDQTADGFDLYDIDGAETTMALAADRIASLEAALAAIANPGTVAGMHEQDRTSKLQALAARALDGGEG